MVGGKHQNINNHTGPMVGGKHRGPCRGAPASTQWDREGHAILNKAAAHKLGLHTFVCLFIHRFVCLFSKARTKTVLARQWLETQDLREVQGNQKDSQFKFTQLVTCRLSAEANPIQFQSPCSFLCSSQ